MLEGYVPEPNDPNAASKVVPLPVLCMHYLLFPLPKGGSSRTSPYGQNMLYEHPISKY